MNQKVSKKLTKKGRTAALASLGLWPEFSPTIKISHIFESLRLDNEKLIYCLRTNPSEDARIICAMWDRVSAENKQFIDLDDVIVSASTFTEGHKPLDSFKILGMIVENYAKVTAMETELIASVESPRIMEKRAKFAKERKGFQDARMILQSTGAAPVPKNQTNYLIGNRIDASKKTVNINVPKHEDAVGEVSRILNSVTDVLPGEDSEEDSGSREGEESKAERVSG